MEAARIDGATEFGCSLWQSACSTQCATSLWPLKLFLDFRLGFLEQLFMAILTVLRAEESKTLPIK